MQGTCRYGECRILELGSQARRISLWCGKLRSRCLNPVLLAKAQTLKRGMGIAIQVWMVEGGWIAEVGQAIATADSLDRLAQVLREGLGRMLSVDRVALAAVDRERSAVTLLAAKSRFPLRLAPGYSESLNDSTLYGILRSRRPRFIHDLEDYLRRKPGSKSTRLICEEGMLSSLTVPLVYRESPTGILFVSSTRRNAYLHVNLPWHDSLSACLGEIVERERLIRDLGSDPRSDLLLVGTPLPAALIDPKGVIRGVSPSLEELQGENRRSLVGGPRSRLSRRKEGLPEGSKGIPPEAEPSEYKISIRGEETALVTWSDPSLIKRLESDLLTAQVLASVGDLAAAVANEAKNPLAGISGAMQILRDALSADDPRTDIVDEVLKQVGRLDRLVRDLLAFASLKAAERFAQDLAAVLRAVGEALHPEARAKGIDLRVEEAEPFAARIDRPLMETALWNLVSNALDATPSGGAVRLGCRRSGKQVSVFVEDSGPGIPTEMHEIVFKPFFTTKAKGTGLGLAIVKRVVEAHGGRIRIERAPSGGARFVLEWSDGGSKDA